MGAIYDAIVDLRPDSPTYTRWVAVELTAENRCVTAHGFQTLLDDSEVFYLMSEFYHLEAAMGVRWDDPAFGIEWRLSTVVIISAGSELPRLHSAQ